MKVSTSQARWFRLRRSGLVDPFKTPVQTARRLIGVQAQMPAAADLAFWNRTAGCTPAKLKQARLVRRELVRFWGQRNTVHLFATTDWPLLHTIFAERLSITRKKFEEAGLLEELERVVRRIGKRLGRGEPLTHKDVKSKEIETRQDKWVVSYAVFMQLVRLGLACHGPDKGAQSTFVHRELWLPDLSWLPPAPEQAMPMLACRYLAAYGPAEPRDLAFWCGTTVTNAKRWIEAAGDRCAMVEVDGREHWCRREDFDDLAVKPPPAARWPVRLLYRFDPILLATKDKSWLIDDEHYKKVWRAAAHVEAVLLVRGRIAGTWRYDRKARGLVVRVSPFARLSATVSRAAEKQAAAVAAFLGLELAGVESSGPG